MKRLSPSFVPVRKITSKEPRSRFSDNDIEQVAQLILRAEGVINPIVLRRTSMESYEVVNGHLEYYAASRARDIDLQKGEMIGAFILEPGDEEVITAQVKLLRESNLVAPDVVDLQSHSINVPSQNDQVWIRSQITRLNDLSTELKSQIIELKSQIIELNAQFEKGIRKLDDGINELLSEKISRSKPKIASEEIITPEEMKILEEINTFSPPDLLSKFKKVGIKGKTASNVVEKILKEREKQRFTSLKELETRGTGIAKARREKIIKDWL